ncbi:DUF2510 domain-containing protein, partial [Ilumatobacter sp.]|uniref:DUF2510 domain-containing protein n=1 Tax=Ilumatobacter sp. TaxID=1967498 RepID=UPI003C3A585B
VGAAAHAGASDTTTGEPVATPDDDATPEATPEATPAVEPEAAPEAAADETESAPEPEPEASVESAPAETPLDSGVPAGWYADPSGRFELRYWDGSAWTEHVSRAGQQYTDPPVA